MARKPGVHQIHAFVPLEDWQTIKEYCNRSGRALYATDFIKVFLRSFAIEARKRMEMGEFASSLDLVEIPKLTESMLDRLENHNGE